jgi:hypothetical protein
VPRRIVASLCLAVTVVLLSAAPALGTEEEFNVPEADIQHPWHYWISFALAAGFVLFVLAQAVMYYLKVVRGPRK